VLKGETNFSGYSNTKDPNANDPYTRTGVIESLNILEIDHLQKNSSIDGNGGSILINNYVQPTNGNLNSNSGKLVFKAEFDNTFSDNIGFFGKPSVIGSSPCINGVPKSSITGDVYVERPIFSPVVSTRLLSPGLIPHKTIFESYQESKNNFPGYGTYVLNFFPSGTDGYDTGKSINTISYFNEKGIGLFPNTNTFHDNWGLGKGVILQFFGDRLIDLSTLKDSLSSNHENSILRTYGALNSCAFEISKKIDSASFENQKFLIYGNPFWSFLKIGKSNPLSIEYNEDIKSEYLYFNPYLQGTSDALGGFRTVNFYNLFKEDHVYIHPGQSFFMPIIGPKPNIVFHPEGKIKDQIHSFESGEMEENMESIIIEGHFKFKNSNYSKYPFSSVRVSFAERFSNEIGLEDSYPIAKNSFENLFIKNLNKELVIEGRKPLTSIDTVQLKLNNLFKFTDNKSNNLQYGLKISTQYLGDDKVCGLQVGKINSNVILMPNSFEFYPMDLASNVEEFEDVYIFIINKDYKARIDEELAKYNDKIVTFPNPTTDIINVVYNFLPGSKIEIYNTLGQLVDSRIISNNAIILENGIKFDLGDFPVGFYDLRLIDKEGKVYHSKISKL
ncbi:MAG: Secretion system C-terminal sorting domain, partial [Bacteroidota bacterium]